MHRWTLLWMIPINLFLVVWIWIGRIVFGVGGWFFLIMAPVALVVAVALLVTTVLALTQHGRPRALTGLQHGAQLATWLGLLGVGAFLPDFGDTEDSYTSSLTQLLGYSDAVMSASWVLTLASAALAVVAWLVLLVALVAGRRREPAALAA